MDGGLGLVPGELYFNPDPANPEPNAYPIILEPNLPFPRLLNKLRPRTVLGEFTFIQRCYISIASLYVPSGYTDYFLR